MYLKQPTTQQVKLQHTLQLLARTLRDQPTPAEQVLWSQLKNKQLGYKFRCQYPLFRFIVDFYCSTVKLVIEVDGGIHKTRQEHDHLRDQYLTQAGYQVIRFTNAQVIYSLPEVIVTIQSYLPCKGMGVRLESTDKV